jgi:biopolymer transport protein ExbD
MSMNVGGGKRHAMADINITPYIDILLVLLIIFMVITPIKQMDLEVKVPQTSNNDAPGAIDPSVIVVSIESVEKTFRIAINQNETTISKLGADLQEIYSARANKNMFISASPKLAYDDVVRVIDIAKAAGVGDIGLLTEEIR